MFVVYHTKSVTLQISHQSYTGMYVVLLSCRMIAGTPLYGLWTNTPGMWLNAKDVNIPEGVWFSYPKKKGTQRKCGPSTKQLTCHESCYHSIPLPWAIGHKNSKHQRAKHNGQCTPSCDFTIIICMYFRNVVWLYYTGDGIQQFVCFTPTLKWCEVTQWSHPVKSPTQLLICAHKSTVAHALEFC